MLHACWSKRQTARHSIAIFASQGFLNKAGLWRSHAVILTSEPHTHTHTLSCTEQIFSYTAVAQQVSGSAAVFALLGQACMFVQVTGRIAPTHKQMCRGTRVKGVLFWDCKCWSHVFRDALLLGSIKLCCNLHDTAPLLLNEHGICDTLVCTLMVLMSEILHHQQLHSCMLGHILLHHPFALSCWVNMLRLPAVHGLHLIESERIACRGEQVCKASLPQCGGCCIMFVGGGMLFRPAQVLDSERCSVTWPHTHTQLLVRSTSGSLL